MTSSADPGLAPARGGTSRKGLISMAAKLSGAGLGLLVNVILAKRLGAEGFGLFAFAVAAASLVSMLASFGLPFGAIRHLPDYIARRDWSSLAGFVRLSLVASLVGAGLMAGILLSVPLLAEVEISTARALAWAALLVLPMTMVQTLAALLQARGHVVGPEITQGLARQVVAVALLFAWPWVTGTAFGVSPALIVLASSFLLSMIVMALLLRRAMRHDPPAAEAAGRPHYDLPLWSRTGLAVLLILIAASLNDKLDILLLGWLVDPAEVGIYAAAARLAGVASMALAGLNVAFMPRVAAAWAEGDLGRTEALCQEACRVSVAVAATMLAGAVLLGRPVLAAFGPEFVHAHSVLILLVAAQLGIAIGGMSGGLAVVAGRSRLVVVTQLGCILVNVALIFLLTPILGILGTALSAAICIAAGQIVVGLICGPVLGIRLTLLPIGPRFSEREAAS